LVVHQYLKTLRTGKTDNGDRGKKEENFPRIGRTRGHLLIWSSREPIIQSGQHSEESMEDDVRYMGMAIEEAKKAAAVGEVPVGCVIVSEGEVIGRAHNLRETDADPTAHAEIVALRQAAKALGHWRVTPATCYVTCEPCPMCAGALVNARVDRLVYGCVDPKAGASGTLYEITTDARLNHRLEVTGGVMSEECASLLSEFFRSRR